MKIVSILVVLFALSAFADTKVELLARTDYITSHKLPQGSSVLSSTPTINNRGDVSFKTYFPVDSATHLGLWVNGEIVHVAKKMRLISDPSMNKRGDVVFSQFDIGVNEGIYRFDGVNRAISLDVEPDKHPTLEEYTFAQINDRGSVLFRGKTAKGEREFILNGKKLLVEANGVSFLFRPTLNNKDQVVAKVRFGKDGEFGDDQPDRILLIEGRTATVLAQDRDANPKSEIARIANSLALNDAGQVVFHAQLVDGSSALFIFRNGFLFEVAREGRDGVEKISSFAPAINEKGDVVFRGRSGGKEALFLVKAFAKPEVLLSAEDVLATDVGLTRIHAFMAGIDINDSREIVFNTILKAFDEDEFRGEAIFKLTAP